MKPIDIARKTVFAAGFLVGGIGTWAQIQNAILLSRAHAAWERGELARELTIGPRGERSRDFLDSNGEKLRVSFTDQNGTRHSVTFDLWALNTPIDDGKPAIVRYDPQDPSRAALSWLQEVERHRWGAVALQMAFALGLMGLCARRWRAH